MTFFWLAVLALMAGAMLVVLSPMLRPPPPSDVIDKGVAFYRARAAEIRRQQAAGEISPGEAEAALAEQGRGLLALDRAERARGGALDAAGIGRRKAVAVTILLGLPALSLLLYLVLGAPNRADLPLAARQVPPPQLDVAAAMERIEAHLAKNPDDGRGFEVIAPVYLRAERFAEAARAYRRALELLGPTPARLADLGESLVAEAGGTFGPEAREAFAKALALDPRFAKARYYGAIAREQAGDGAGAIADLEALVIDLPEGAARLRVGAELERLRAGGTRLGAAESGAASAQSPPADREAAIRAMVDNLEARIERNGAPIDDWRRLIQSRIVLGDQERAARLIARARGVFAADAAALATIDALLAGVPAEGRVP